MSTENTWFLLCDLVTDMSVPHIFGIQLEDFERWLEDVIPKTKNRRAGDENIQTIHDEEHDIEILNNSPRE